ncbi:MAG TPA: type II toxin-antitoxin system VapC family toxin [Candidatus Binatia bacterium]|jgi:toxin-antitoxin system PIN domain toxin|nr:type II toxin-antitoxin system VapC family toxin [Candidatus Binatia bacterium]
MIIPDINLLLYAYDSSSAYHGKAAAWWQNCLSATEPVGLPQVVVFGFLRLATSSRVFQKPMTPTEAAGHIRSWWKQPAVQLLDPGPEHTEQVLKLIETLGTAGNLVSDAQLAAITIEHGAVLHTVDTDFMRFTDLRWFNPLSGIGSGTVRKPRS